jgi:hypothetical protein
LFDQGLAKIDQGKTLMVGAERFADKRSQSGIS